jgi:hypothetical protein
MRIVKAYAAFAGILLAAGGAAPASAGPVSEAGWDFPPKAEDRVIEVIDRIPDRRWNVAGAVKLIDKRTASRMKMVKSCSATAYRCITVRAGRVGQKSTGPVGWSRGSTITIDTVKARNTRYGKYYRVASARTWLLAHELGHQFGLAHSSGRNLMNPSVRVRSTALTAKQRAHLRKV